MVNVLHIYIFGDQTLDISANLWALIHSKSSPILQSFFEEVYHKLRAEIGQLPARDKAIFPRFSSIPDLLAWRKTQDKYVQPIENALTCTYQLAYFISKHDGFEKPYPSPTESLISGFCTGALSAAAISCCNTISELLPVAVQTVSIAFRTGLCALNAAKAVEPLDGNWSMVVSGRSPEEVSESLERFSQSHYLPRTSQPWISAHAEDWLTISGTPVILTSLRRSEEFAGIHSRLISVYAPYHAPHLFSKTDIEAILENTPENIWERYRGVIPVVSTTTGSLVHAENLRYRLETALDQILIEPVRSSEFSQGVASVLIETGASQFKIIPVGTNAEATLTAFLSSNLEASSAPVPDIESETSTDKSPADDAVRGRSKIAIIGISGRYPSAENNEQYWDLILNGLDVHKVVPDLHWSAKSHVDPTGKKKNTSATPYGCWLEHPADFDAMFFNMSPREAPQVDPAQRIALMTAYEAIEQAGIVPDATPSTRKDRVGVFYGVTSNDWMETNSAQNIDTYFIPGGNRAFIPGRINYFFKFSGPSYSVDTACSSSLASIQIACNALWRGDIDTAIAGGTNVLTNPDFTSGLDRGHFLSRTGNCKTFDDGADGYCRGEGVVTLILKRLEDAIADKDPIQGLVLGTYTNHSAEAESITRPHVGAQRDIFHKILSSSGVDPYSVSYVEMHGTGTQAGDAREMSSVLDIFAPANSRQNRLDDQELHLGSVKANIGHGEAASGVSAISKVLLMMRNNTIPPHCGIKTKINSKFPTDLDVRNVHIAKEAKPWNRVHGQPRRAFVNNFSAAGGNSAVLLEEKPLEIPVQGVDIRTSHVVAVSAKSPVAMARNLKSLITYIDSHCEESLFLPQLSYTTTARRTHHLHRVMVTGSAIDDIKRKLEAAAARGDGATRPKSAPKLTFAFTGQGSQYVGMAKQLYESFSQFRIDIRRFDQLGQAMGFPTFTEIIDDSSGKDIKDFSPVSVQLASVCIQMALSRLLNSWNIIPEVVVGHSLGEYAALHAAGVLSDADTIFLVGNRAQLLERLCTINTHSMLVVKSSLSAVKSALEETEFEIACLNAPEETVLAGPNEKIETLHEALSKKLLTSKILHVPFAYHSSQMDVILEDFEVLAKGVTFRKPLVPVISPLLAEVITDAGVIGPDYIRRHCRETVNFLDSSRFAKDNGTLNDGSFVVEIGPHSVVTGMMKAIHGSAIVAEPTLQRNRDDWKILTQTITSLYCAGADIRWNEYHRDFAASHRVLELPAYNWVLKEYWMQYVNDWSLRKGDPPLVAPSVTPLASTTIHTVLEDSINKVTVESDMARPDFNPLVQGHEVDGVPLCTPSVYADIALTVGKYLLDRYHPEIQDRLVDIAHMEVLKALIAKPEGPQPLRTFITVDWATKRAKARFCSFDKKGEPTVEHANCEIHFTDRSRVQKLEAAAQQVKERMAAMRMTLSSGETQRFNRTMVYKMISPLAQFHKDYRPIDEVVMDSDTHECASRVTFKGVEAAGNFHTHPAYIDGLTQAGGFVMNCNDSNDLDVEVYVNHGWESLQIYETLDKDMTYRTFCQMFEKDNRKFQGDVVVFDESDKIVASYQGIVFQGLPRRVLRFFLKPEAPNARAVTQAKNKEKPTGVSMASPKVFSPAVPVVTKTALAKSSTAAYNPSKIEPALKIISEESGIALSDLTDECVFADIGVDSLLSLVITSRFREELGIDLEMDDIFNSYPSVKDLKGLLAKQAGVSESVLVDENLPTVVTKATEIMRQAPVLANTVPLEIAISDRVGPDFHAALGIVSEESGIAVSDLTDDCNFSDIGIDSLLSLVIVSRFREELDLEIEMDSVFIDYPTVKDLRSFFRPVDSPNSTRAPSVRFDSSDQGANTSITSADSDSEQDMGHVKQKPAPVPAATSVLLQGIPKYADKTLFLFPDGAGSASSYSGIPKISPKISIIALNSPYYKIPELFKCNLDDLVDSYINEIRRRQPNGPYNFGGWSAGGILAYRATQKLIAAGEAVHNLILIDSPVPKGLDKLPQHFYDHCNKYNVFGHGTRSGKSSAKAPEWLIPHFNATIDTLHDYHATPLHTVGIPKTYIIWAGESVLDGVDVPKLPPRPDDTEGMTFLTQQRTDFSAAGWQELFPGGNYTRSDGGCKSFFDDGIGVLKFDFFQ